jgi:hypothetical protein
MKQKIAMKIIDECGNLFDTLPSEELTTWNYLIEVNNIVSHYKGVDCLMHLNFANGNVTQCMCVITDWEPGAIALQSDDGDLPKMRVVYPEEYIDFMKEMEPIFDAKYPKFPDKQE